MNFKKFNRIIEEGGAYGHMANVHEDYTLQFEDLQNIIRQALTGGIQGTIKEKTDGQALAVGYRAGLPDKFSEIKSPEINNILIYFKGFAEVFDARLFSKYAQRAEEVVKGHMRDPHTTMPNPWMHI